GAETTSPPVTVCINETCKSAGLAQPLGEESVVEARLYTLRRGVLPVFSKSLYCRSCNTRYYNNYFVQNASKEDSRWQYYSAELPALIHVTKTSYVEQDLCKYFRVQMALSHNTCQGISRVYNQALGNSELPNSSRLSHELTGELVLEAFILHALLQDQRKHGDILSLPHRAYQEHCFDQAMADRNLRMAGDGQDMWAHACDRCMKIYQGEDGNWYRMTAGVHDGVSVRHVCCSVHDCLQAVSSQRDLFCFAHRDLLKVCCIKGCNSMAEPGFRTCSIESHRAFQKAGEERNTAMFQLHTPSAASSGAKVKGKLARSWTHNEQLFVRCCGVIISRATFFGSEGITGVTTFLKATFPPKFPGVLPSYIFYDNNCQFLKHLRSVGDHYFDNVGLPVDVFHFKCKHSEGDLFCQAHCNLARFRELHDREGKWIFNSSAAEQANVWFGKFQNVVQDMPILPPRYNFYLDEMIAIHNDHIVGELATQGHAPHLQSETLLRGGYPFI
ncbi:hypothetical protein B0H13DRAFT_1625428, partial [Mycena leptocephala]